MAGVKATERDFGLSLGKAENLPRPAVQWDANVEGAVCGEWTWMDERETFPDLCSCSTQATGTDPVGQNPTGEKEKPTEESQVKLPFSYPSGCVGDFE